MNNTKKHDVELRPDEYAALMRNEMILSICEQMLASPRRRGGCVVLRLTAAQLDELAGWVAAEANHAKTRAEEDVLGEVCEQLESVLSGVKRPI